MPRIAIIGAGAIGSVLGALLSRAGHDVTLIGRPAHVDRIQRDGLHVEGAFGSFVASVSAAATLDFQPDLAFLTVKTQDVLAAVQANQQFLTDALVVTFQNGIRSDELVAKFLPPTQIISAVVTLNASYLTPGTVTVVYPGSVVLGRSFGHPDSHVDAVAAMLHRVIATQVSANIVGARWLKLIVNLNNALPALTNLAFHEVLAEPYLRQLAVRLMREGLHVVNQADIHLESLPDVSTTLIRLLARLPVQLAGGLLAARARRLATRGPLLVSTLQSLRRGRSTEIDYLNGEVVRVGHEHNVPTPLNATIVEMVHQTEQTGRFWTVDAIRARISASARSQHAV
ncbi:ketopantoate reductase family protein [Rubrobacter xylanophilus]|uniref:ketopantoate reductase family protein n=1 Tax=Rubrobacter xylanophilus TaxID=49319 RepID=UPI001C63EAE6|nr:2-dehydropantoate 2-reductase [Rubrobacter xylanophilus]